MDLAEPGPGQISARATRAHHLLLNPQRHGLNVCDAVAGTQAALRGCINDVRAMYAMLRNHYGFEPANMRCLIDEDPKAAADKLPTGANIKKSLAAIVAAAAPGDILFIHFSGHGTQVRPHLSLQGSWHRT